MMRATHTVLFFALVLSAYAVRAKLIVTSSCGLGLCRTRAIGTVGCYVGDEPACQCWLSQPGVPCAECNWQGYIDGDQCVCDAPHDNQDPDLACLPIVPVTEVLPVNSTTAKAPCACFNDTTLGCFAPTNVGNIIGVPNPQSCQSCCNDGFGPPFGTVDDSLAGNVPSGMCTMYGNIAFNTSDWVECSGNGQWNSTQIGCECGLGYDLAPTGFTDFFGNEQLSCEAFAPGYGPGPSIDGPSPLNGTLLECSGLGTYDPSTDSCLCFAGVNATIAYTYEAYIYQLDRTRPGYYLYPVTVNATVVTCSQ